MASDRYKHVVSCMDHGGPSTFMISINDSVVFFDAGNTFKGTGEMSIHHNGSRHHITLKSHDLTMVIDLRNGFELTITGRLSEIKNEYWLDEHNAESLTVHITI